MEHYQALGIQHKSCYQQLNTGHHTLSFASFLGGCGAIFVGLEGLLNIFSPSSVILSAYMILGGILVLMLEAQIYCWDWCCDWFTIPMNYWSRYLSRMWGRGLFLFLMGTMAFARKNIPLLDYIVGFYLLGLGIFCFVLGRVSARKLQNIATRIKRGKGQSEQELKIAFDDIDKDKSGEIDAAELKSLFDKLGEDIHGQEFRAALEYIDRDNNGTISFDEFKKWYTGNKPIFV